MTVAPNSGLVFSTSNGSITAFDVGSLAGSGAINLADGAHPFTLVAGGNGALTTYSGALGGAGGLAKTGSGTLVLGGSNSYSGGTTLSGGEFEHFRQQQPRRRRQPARLQRRHPANHGHERLQPGRLRGQLVGFQRRF